MALTSFKGVNQVLDVVSSLQSVESTTVYPTGVLIVNSSGNLKLGDGSTAGGTAVGTAASVAFADITGKPTTLAGYGITDTQFTGTLLVTGGGGIRWANALGTRSVADQDTPDIYDQSADTLSASHIYANQVYLKDGGKIGKNTNNSGALIPTAGTGYNGPSVKDLVLGSEHGVGVFLDPGNDDSGSAFTIWSNINPYSGSPGEDNYKLKLNGDTGNLGIAGRVTAIGGFRGDLTGSVFGDDSTTIVDSVNNRVTSTLVANPGTAPTTNSPGETGEIRFDDNYIYVKTAGAGWKRANLSGIA